MKKIINILIIAGIVVGTFFALERFKKPEEEIVKEEIIRPVKSITLRNNGDGGVWKYFGTLQGGRRVELSFRVSGPIRRIYVDKGDSVKRGTLLATLDTRDFQNQLKQAKSAQAQAQAHYNNAQMNFKRYENLYKKNAVSKSTYDNQKTEVDVARSALESAKSQTALVRDSLRDTELRAPYDGVIVDRLVENFQDVTAKQPIFRLQDISTLEVVFNVPESDIIGRSTSNRQFDSIYARFDAMPNRVFPLTIKEFVLQSDPNTNTYPVTATMASANDVILLPGMSATVEAEFKDAPNVDKAQFRIPSGAVFTSEQKKYVWQCVNGEVHKVPVTVSTPFSDGYIEISAPALKGGDDLIVAGVHLLKEGQKVRLMK